MTTDTENFLVDPRPPLRNPQWALPPNAEAMAEAHAEAGSIPETAMIDRCATCAFRADTPASRSWWTVALRNLCVMSGTPFLCHDAGDGHMCRGFVDAFTAKLTSGEYDRLSEWKNQLARKLIDVLQDYREASERGEMFDDGAVMAAIEEVCGNKVGTEGTEDEG